MTGQILYGIVNENTASRVHRWCCFRCCGSWVVLLPDEYPDFRTAFLMPLLVGLIVYVVEMLLT